MLVGKGGRLAGKGLALSDAVLPVSSGVRIKVSVADTMRRERALVEGVTSP